jgi:hypothetical protein
MSDNRIDHLPVYTISRGVHSYDSGGHDVAMLRREVDEARTQVAALQARVANLEEVMLRPMPDYKMLVPGTAE